MKNTSTKIYSVMYILLIASLPLFSVRFSFLYGGSLSLYILITISVISFLSMIITGRIKRVISQFDLLLISLIAISVLSILLQETNNHSLAIFKTLVYFAVYLSLKLIIYQFSAKEIEEHTLKGVYIGLTIFTIIIFYALSKAGGIMHLLSTFDYFNFTYRIFEQINTFTSNKDFSSKDIMRNALGEVFAFYFIFLLIVKNNQNKTTRNWISMLLSILYVVITFSRRALFSSIISVFLVVVKTSKKSSASSLFLLSSFAVVIYFLVFNVSDESRLTSLSISGRSSQFDLAMASLSDSLLTGKGYGEKLLIPALGEKIYIHNFILSNFYTLGIPGLILSFFIFIKILYSYIKSILDSTPNHNLLLLIPLLGMLVGGTTEGMFTITAWIILALTDFYRKKEKLSSK